MKTLRTTLSPGRSAHLLTLQDAIVTAGSCFADAMGHRMLCNKIKTLQNPLGVIYNPASIHRALLYAIKSEMPGPETFLLREDIHANYDLHSLFSSLNKKELESKIRTTLLATHQFLKQASVLILTYGTAWVYARKDNSTIVANCHKMPGNLFNKYLLHQKNIIQSFEVLFHAIKVLNPKIRIILTVSPVRHVKDTLELNAVSKSVLRLTCHTLSESSPDIDYFPAYEIMMDDLRDYRFYKSDLIHPTDEAEDYIWEEFEAKYYDQSSQTFFKKWASLRHALNHRPFHPTSQSNQLFLKDLLAKLEELNSVVNVNQEISSIKNQLL